VQSVPDRSPPVAVDRRSHLLVHRVAAHKGWPLAGHMDSQLLGRSDFLSARMDCSGHDRLHLHCCNRRTAGYRGTEVSFCSPRTGELVSPRN